MRTYSNSYYGFLYEFENICLSDNLPQSRRIALQFIFSNKKKHFLKDSVYDSLLYNSKKARLDQDFYEKEIAFTEI